MLNKMRGKEERILQRFLIFQNLTLEERTRRVLRLISEILEQTLYKITGLSSLILQTLDDHEFYLQLVNTQMTLIQ